MRHSRYDSGSPVGYRIRQLTAAEEAEKVRDDVRRLREGEKMLVRNYKAYLKTLETEVKREPSSSLVHIARTQVADREEKSSLAPLAIKCLCDLLATHSHFNFAENITGVLLAVVSRRTLPSEGRPILATFATVFRSDLSGTVSQTLVRLLARMVKERKFQVHPDVVGCLVHLRLKDELKGGSISSRSRGGGDRAQGGQQFKSELRKKWATKKQRKKRERAQSRPQGNGRSSRRNRSRGTRSSRAL